MQLVEYVAVYISEHDVSGKYATGLRTAVNHFTTFAGDKPLEEITSAALNAWIEHEGQTKHKHTVKNKLTHLCTLLRAAIAAGLRGPFDGKLKCPKVVIGPIKGFTPEDVAALIEQAKKAKGWFKDSGISRSDFWVAFLMTGWDTGMRVGDLLELEYAHIDGKTRRVAKVQHKTGRQHVARLRPETYAAIQRLREQTDTSRVFPYANTPAGLHKLCWYFRRQIASPAGVKGTLKYLRRGGATQVFKTQGPAATAKYLGHADGTGTLAYARYVDRTQLDDQVPTPSSFESVHSTGTKPSSLIADDEGGYWLI